MQMSGRIRYTEEFKQDAVAQVKDRGYSVRDVASRLGISTKSLYDWIKEFSKTPQQSEQDLEIKKLRKELARVTEERDIFKKRPRTSRRLQSELRLY